MIGTILTTVRDGYVLGVFESPNKAMDFLNENKDCGASTYEALHPSIIDKQSRLHKPQPLSSTITLGHWSAEGGFYKPEYRLTEIPEKP